MPRRPTSRDLDSLTHTTKTAIARAVNSLADGRTDAGGFADRMHAALTRGHGRAGYLGRRRAGDFSAFGDADRVYGEAVADGEKRYLDTFAQDILSGRYTDVDGNLIAEKIRGRAFLYTFKLRGTANESLINTFDAEELIEWHLGAVKEHHCTDCPDIAAGSPYRADAIPTFPGAGQTQCVFRCHCSVSRKRDGLAGF